MIQRSNLYCSCNHHVTALYRKVQLIRFRYVIYRSTNILSSKIMSYKKLKFLSIPSIINPTSHSMLGFPKYLLLVILVLILFGVPRKFKIVFLA